MTTRVFAVDGMSCGHCVKAITDEVSSVPGVSAVQVDLAGRTVAVDGSDAVDDAAVRAAIEEAGYTVAGSVPA